MAAQDVADADSGGRQVEREQGREPGYEGASGHVLDRCDRPLRELSLFTGAGGGLLGSLILGWEPVQLVERDPYCQLLLSRRFPTVPLHGDVRVFHPAPGSCDIVTGGFPCQPHSQAGKRLGGKDDRDLWPDTVRILRESGAPLGFFENVSGLLTSRDADGLPMFGRILGDLSEAGFDAEWVVLGADDVGAPHRRKRLWILAHAKGHLRRASGHDGRVAPDGAGDREELADSKGFTVRSRLRPDEQAGEWRGRSGDGYSPWWCDPADVGDADEPGPQGHGAEHELPAAGGPESVVGAGTRTDDDWLLEPYVGRVAHGVASRVDRLRALGNGQVPQSMAWAFTVLARDAGVLR